MYLLRNWYIRPHYVRVRYMYLTSYHMYIYYSYPFRCRDSCFYDSVKGFICNLIATYYLTFCTVYPCGVNISALYISISLHKQLCSVNVYLQWRGITLLTKRKQSHPVLEIYLRPIVLLLSGWRSAYFSTDRHVLMTSFYGDHCYKTFTAPRGSHISMQIWVRF